MFCFSKRIRLVPYESKKKTSNNKRNIILTRYTIALSSFSRSSRLSVCYFSSRIYLADVRSKVNRILTCFNSANYSCRERKVFSILPSSFYSLHPVTNNGRSRPPNILDRPNAIKYTRHARTLFLFRFWFLSVFPSCLSSRCRHTFYTRFLPFNLAFIRVPQSPITAPLLFVRLFVVIFWNLVDNNLHLERCNDL